MCGIAGYCLKKLSKEGFSKIPILAKAIEQRGPDDEGVCLIARNKKLSKFYKTERTLPGIALDHIEQTQSMIPHDVALVHARYSIIDLTAGGHQPFSSSDGKIVVVFNGEIFNYLELREELFNLGVSFRTCSDTEVLVQGYRIWGHQIWAKLNGFWAIALYDCSADSLILSRDRLGVAPLYYREAEDGMYFSSSMQGLIDIDRNGIEIDKDKAEGFIQTSLKDFDNSTFYQQVKSVPPAAVFTYGPNVFQLESATKLQYWNFPKSRLSVKDLSFQEAVQGYRETFFNAVEIRLRADVKVAFELSGGLDSSSAVAAGAILKDQKITTFTIQVPEENEEPYARSILERYGDIDYRILSDSENDFLSEQLPFNEIMEEPFHSPNIYTHYKMRQQMKDAGFSVVVAGAGGDEVLAGYESKFWPKASAELQRDGYLWHSIQYEIAKELRTGQRIRRLKSEGRRILGSMVRCGIKLAFCFARQSYSRDHTLVEHILNEDQWKLTQAEIYRQEYSQLTFHEQSIFHLTVGLIPYYLRSNDHFTMGIPLEHRFPFLDYRMVELGLQMPISYLFKNGWTKYILRKAMEPYLPEKILWRKTKMGFPFAYKRFLSVHSGFFRPLVDRLLTSRIRARGYVGYQQLLEKNPEKLWRLCSTALWLSHLNDSTLPEGFYSAPRR
jgi:asparagine synthase (glutamine-hydrolysing)